MTIELRALYGERDAAAYLGISATTLRALPIPRRCLGARRLYDRRDLDAYVDGLPYEGEGGGDVGKEVAACDAVFGTASG